MSSPWSLSLPFKLILMITALGAAACPTETAVAQDRTYMDGFDPAKGVLFEAPVATGLYKAVFEDESLKGRGPKEDREEVDRRLRDAQRRCLPVRVGLTPDGMKFVGVTSTGVVRVFDARTGKSELLLSSQSRAGSEVFASSGQRSESSVQPKKEAMPSNTPASSSANELAAIAWVKSVDGRILRGKRRNGKKRNRGPIEFVSLARGAGSDPDAVRVTDDGLSHLAAFSELRRLGLGSSPQVTSKGIKGLSKLPKLVDLSYSPRSKDCVRALSYLTNLQRLNLFQSTVTDSDLSFLSRVPLQKLCLSYTSVSNDGLKHVATLPRLDALHLERTSVSDVGMRQLATMGSLRTLNLSETKITGAGLKELIPLKKLQVLSLGSLGIGDAEVELLSEFGELEMLSLYDNPVTDEGMKAVGRLKELRRLSLVSTKVTDEGFQSLAKCSKLEMVDVYDTKVTRAGIAALKNALPDCVVTLSFSYGEIPDFKITRTKSRVVLEAPEDGWP